MKLFNQGNKSNSNNRSSGKPSMHKAVCDKCGKSCEVPFKPTGDKPIYCNDCFRDRSNRDQRRPGSGEKKMYKTICDKCGKSCEVPFRPTGGKPVYCSDCFGKGGSGSSKDSGQTRKQFEMLNDKLDKILELLAPHVSEEKTASLAESRWEKKKTVKSAKGESASGRKATTTKKKAIIKKPAKKKTTTKKKK